MLYAAWIVKFSARFTKANKKPYRAIRTSAILREADKANRYVASARKKLRLSLSSSSIDVPK